MLNYYSGPSNPPDAESRKVLPRCHTQNQTIDYFVIRSRCSGEAGRDKPAQSERDRFGNELRPFFGFCHRQIRRLKLNNSNINTNPPGPSQPASSEINSNRKETSKWELSTLTSAGTQPRWDSSARRSNVMRCVRAPGQEDRPLRLAARPRRPQERSGSRFSRSVRRVYAHAYFATPRGQARQDAGRARRRRLALIYANGLKESPSRSSTASSVS